MALSDAHYGEETKQSSTKADTSEKVHTKWV